ncbi:hypothetical protein N7486_001162 [Penicillium sp. IBT 16267x]|nr:hypothetical protein N7486_001162 [Penicillium sp. IBT 16267x]
MNVVKLEGGEQTAPSVKRITGAGIPVMAYIGLTPQRQNALGGFRVQGNTAACALNLSGNALAVLELSASQYLLKSPL